MSDTPEIIPCPHCGGKLRVPSLAASRNIQCGHCKQTFEYHPDGIADATLLEPAPTPATAQLKPTDNDDRVVGITAAITVALVAWLLAGMPRMDGIADASQWVAMSFTWDMLKMIFLATVFAIIAVLVMAFVLGMFFSKYENTIHNLMFGLVFGIPVGVALSPLMAWIGNDSEWRTALAHTVLRPESVAAVHSEKISAPSETPLNTPRKKPGSVAPKVADTKDVKQPTALPASNRPTAEPFATCYDLWENVTYKMDPYDGHARYPFDVAEGIEKQYPSCFLHTTNRTSWSFPRFDLGPKAAAVRPQICLDLARNYYYRVLEKKQSKRIFTADATINRAFLSEYQAETGAYCFKPNGDPHFAMDNSARPQPFTRDRCNSTAKAQAARVEPMEKIEALCFNSDGSPIFDQALFADEEGRKNALYAECARNFEPYAKTFLEVWGQDEPDSLEELWTSTLGNLDVFERGNKHCFKQVAGQTTALFPLTGPYARDYRIRAYYHQ